MSTSSISALASQVLASVPTLLVCLVACILILLEWRRGGRASAWAVAGFGLAGLLVLVGPATFWLVSTVASSGQGSEAVFRWMPFVSIGLGFLHALAYGLLLMAVLATRNPRSGIAATGR